MWKRFLKFLKFGAEVGWHLPTAYDADKPGASVSLLFAHLSFYLAFGSIVALINDDLFTGTIAATSFAALYFVFYMLRRLTKAKFDLDDRSFELENNEETKEKKDE